MDVLSRLLNPGVLIFVIPIVAVVMVFGTKMFKAFLSHQERMAKIEAGMDPDTETKYIEEDRED